MLSDPELNDAALQAQYCHLTERVIAHSDVTHPLLAEEAADQGEHVVVDQPTYYVFFKPEEDILKSGTNPLYLIEDLCNLGESQVFAALDGITVWETVEAENCYTNWHIFLSTAEPEDGLREVFLFVEEECQVEVVPLAQQNLLSFNGLYKYISKLDIKNHRLQENDLMQLTDHLLDDMIDDEASSEHSSTSSDVSGKGSKKEQVISSVRVASDKLDSLMNMVSELVTTQARLSLLAETLIIQN